MVNAAYFLRGSWKLWRGTWPHQCSSSFVFLLALVTVVMFAQLDARELWPSHEARAAQAAQQFLTTKSWGVHHLFDGSRDYQKPPFYYWLVAGVAWLRGGSVDAWSVRFPAALAGWLTVLAVTGFLQRRGRPTAGFLAGLTLTTACHFLAISRTGRIDVPLTAAVTFAVVCGWDGKWICAGVAMGLGVLLKGPIGIVLPMVVIGATQWMEHGTGKRSWKKHFGTILIAIMVAAPWFLYVAWETNWEYWRVFFGHHNIDRAAGSADDLARHPMWFYPSRWMIDWLPWSPILLFALWCTSRGWHDFIDVEARLGMTWMLGITVLLSLSQFKRADYLIPAYPGAALLIGCWLERCWSRITFVDRRRWYQGFLGLFVVTISTYALVDHWNLHRERLLYPQRDFAEELRSSLPSDRPIILFRVEDHLLAWHLKPPLISVNEWENLDVWIARNGSGGVIMPPAEAGQWSHWVRNGTLQEVGRMTTGDRSSPRVWVALRSQVPAKHE